MGVERSECRGNGSRLSASRRCARLRIGAATLLAGASSACVADPLPSICPNVSIGALVVTEIRGPQSTPDTRGQWIEIANTSGSTVDLQGVHVVNYQLDGTNEIDAIIRYKRELAADDRFVVGLFEDTDRPEWIDYGFGLGWASDVQTDGVMELRACSETIDEVVYHDLPDVGTWSLGIEPPDADANDDEMVWCNDVLPPMEGPMTELGTPGTPGEANHPCV